MPCPLLHGAESFHNPQPNISLTQLHAIHSSPGAATREQSSVLLFCTPCKEATGCHETSPPSPFLQAEKTKGSQPLCTCLAFHPLHYLCSYLLDAKFHALLTHQCQNLHKVPKVRLHLYKAEWDDPFSHLASSAGSGAPLGSFGLQGTVLTQIQLVFNQNPQIPFCGG